MSCWTNGPAIGHGPAEASDLLTLTQAAPPPLHTAWRAADHSRFVSFWRFIGNFSGGHLLGSTLDGVNDELVAGAAAEIAFKRGTDLLPRRIRVRPQEVRGRH